MQTCSSDAADAASSTNNVTPSTAQQASSGNDSAAAPRRRLEYLGDLLFEHGRSGASSFEEQQALISADVVFVLYGCDLGVRRNQGRVGARQGPSRFVHFFKRMRCPVHNPEYKIDLSNLNLSFYQVPLDDLDLSSLEKKNKHQEAEEGEDEETIIDPLNEAHRRLAEVVHAVLASGGLPFVIGGGNDQSFANWRALRQFVASDMRSQDTASVTIPTPSTSATIAVVNIDAHLDVRPLLEDNKAHSGSPFRQILQYDETNEKDDNVKTVLFEFAAQGSQCSQDHANFVIDKGGSIFWLKDVQRNGVPAHHFRELLDRQRRMKNAYGFVSFDLDAIQASDCPGVSCPANVGLSAQDALDIMRAAGEADHVRMVDMSEMNPEIEDYITPRLAVQMAYSFLLGFCQRRRVRAANAATSGPNSKEKDNDRAYRLRISHLSQLVCVEDVQKQGFRTGDHMGKLNVIEDGTILVDQNGRIAYVGPTQDAPNDIDASQIDNDLDGRGKAAIPGLCDGHTHPVWAGDRVHEFAMKLAGASYMDIHKMGGGINFTVKHTREADEESLYESLANRLDHMNITGTTLVECKSGYGLDTATELRMLRVIDRAHQNLSILDVVGNFCGAHSIPEGSTEEQAIDAVVNEMIPSLAVEQKNGRLSSVRLIDVFAEDGVFSIDSAEKILKAGAQIGLLGNFHGDELTYLGCGELAGKLRCRAVSHLEHVSNEGIAAMKEAHTAAVLLPTTAFVLRITPPPARKLIDSGVPVALGTDFNPNAHCLSMPHVMNLACVTMGMCVEEALVASTLNAAYSMGKQETHGSLEVGKHGDIVLVNVDRWEHIIYQFGGVPPLHAVIKDGVVRYL